MSQNKTDQLGWKVPEYVKQNRHKNWYIIVSILAVIVLFFCFFTFDGWSLEFLGYKSNFLFALIIIIASVVMFLNEKHPTIIVDFTIGAEGVTVGSRFFDYDVFKDFSVLYKPEDDLKNLYFEYKNTFRPRLSIPLMDMDPLTVRDFLVKYLEEDLERSNAPLSEQLTKLLKL